jgi:hypothetical protein
MMNDCRQVREKIEGGWRVDVVVEDDALHPLPCDEPQTEKRPYRG